MRLEAERRGAAVIDHALAWLSGADADPARPLFLWVHLYDPHAPYEPPPEDLARAGGQAYDGEVADADRQVERLLDGLASSGDRARVIAVVSDHGESLGEHGESTHGMLLYDGALRVPHVIAGQGVPAATRREAVTILDVAPTVLAAAGVGTPSTMEGRNLLAAPGSAPAAVYAETDRAADHNPLWAHKADCAFPSATQNEINGKDAANLLSNGVWLVSEGANMPTNLEGVEQFLDAGILYGPGKAANAGGVATSGLEMSQNSIRMSWTRAVVDKKLHGIMKAIHAACVETADQFNSPGNYVNGANIAGFIKVADAMIDQGVV